MTRQQGPVVPRARLRDERGAVAILVALMLTGLLVMGGIVLDIGFARLDKNTNKSAADQAVAAGLQAANAGTGDVYNASAVCAAYRFLINERSSLSGLPADGCASPSATATCTPGDSTTNVSYHDTVTSGVKRYEVWIKMPYSVTDTSTGGAFDNETYSSLVSDTGDPTQQGCDQIGVVIKEWTQPGLSRLASSSELVTRIRSVARVKVGNGDPAPALLILERTECGVLQVGSAGAGSGSHIRVYGSATSPGTIHSDSTATDGSCNNSNNQLIEGKQADGVVAYGATNGVSGLITSVASMNGRPADIVSDGLANVYATTGANETSPGTQTAVTGRKPVTRKPVDRRYLAGMRAVTQSAYPLWSLNHSTPGSPWTRFGCPTSGEMSTMSSMSPSTPVYIDCPGGMSLDGTIAARKVYLHGWFKNGVVNLPNAQQVYVDDTNNSGGIDGTNAINLTGTNGFCVRATTCAPATPSAGQCSGNPTLDSTAKAQVVIRRGAVAGNGGLLRLCNTTVVMEGGDTGNGTAANPGGCLPLTNGTAPTPTPCQSSAGDSSVSTAGAVDWTAPNAYSDMNAQGLTTSQQQAMWDGGEDLALWTETYGSGTTYKMAGGGAMHVAGVFMVPNAFPFQISGGGSQDLTNAQYIVRSFSVAGGATLTMKVDPNNVVGLPSLYDFRMVR